MVRLPCPDKEIETETDTDTDKLTQNPRGICVYICLCVVWTTLYNSVPVFHWSVYWSLSPAVWTHHYGIFIQDGAEDRNRDQEQMGCMKLCGKIHITPEPGQGPRPYVPHCSGPSSWSCFGSSSAECEYTIKGIKSKHINNTGCYWCSLVADHHQ